MGHVLVQEGCNPAAVPPNAFPSLLGLLVLSQLAAWGPGVQMSAATEASQIFPRREFPVFGPDRLTATLEQGGSQERNTKLPFRELPRAEFRERANFVGCRDRPPPVG